MLLLNIRAAGRPPLGLPLPLEVLSSSKRGLARLPPVLPLPPRADETDSVRRRRDLNPPSRLPKPARKLSVMRRSVSSTSAREPIIWGMLVKCGWWSSVPRGGPKGEGGVDMDALLGGSDSDVLPYLGNSMASSRSRSLSAPRPPRRGARVSIALTNSDISSSSVGFVRG